MYLEQGITMPAVTTGVPILQHPAQVGIRLALTHDELLPIAYGSNLPRQPWEEPLADIEYPEIAACSVTADQLTAVAQDVDLRWDAHARDAGMAKEHFIGVHPNYRMATVRMLGDWAQRYAHYQQTQGAEQEQTDAAFTAFNVRCLSLHRRHIANLLAIYVLPIDTRFWDKVQ